MSAANASRIEVSEHLSLQYSTLALDWHDMIANEASWQIPA